MKRFSSLLLIAAGSLTALAAHAQDQQVPGDIKNAVSFRVPIHTQVADPIGGEYGTWASGDEYKVSFHGDMTYYPVVAGVEGQVSWKTTSVRIGAQELLKQSEAVRHNTDWRYEYRYGTVIEAYDVRPEGVEQTFVLSSIPATGDLVVSGRVSSKLQASEMAARHGAITFRDLEGQAIVEYGAATVLDAAGRSLQITTELTGDTVQLRVPAAWLAGATAPVTVDPLLSTVVVRNSSGFPVDIGIARDDETNQLLVGYVRWTGFENDLFVSICDEDFTNHTAIYSDVTTSWKVRHTSLAFIGGGDKWVMSFTREFSSTSEAVRYRFHPKGLRQFQSNYKVLSRPGNRPTSASDLGGTAAFSSGTKALIVFESVDTSPGGPNTDVWGAFLDASNESAGAAFLLSSEGSSVTKNRDRHYPTVTPESDGGSSSWVVAWQEYNHLIVNDDLDVMAAKIAPSGLVTAPSFLGVSSSTRSSSRPHVAGRGGRYLVAFREDSHVIVSGANLFVQRFDWAESASSPNKQVARPIRTNPNFRYVVGGIAYDQENRSHWLVVSKALSPNQIVFADLVGHAGGVAEALQVSPIAQNSDSTPAVTYNDDTDQFAVLFGSTANKLYGRMMQRHNAKTSIYGVGCGAGTVSGVGLPHSGTEFFKVRLSGVAPNSNAFLSLALAPATISLDFIGMTGCFANTDPNLALVTIPFVTGATNGEVQLPLPAPISADVYAQMIYMNPGVNALGIQATKGLKVEIR